MRSEQEWMKFLLKPENLPCALEVGGHYAALKHAVHDDLYTRLTVQLEAHLKKRSALKEWAVERDEAAVKWASVKIMPRSLPNDCPGVYVRLERCDVKPARMILGVGTFTGLAALAAPKVQPLIDAMEARDFSLVHKAWVRRRWMEHYPEDHDFCVEAMASPRIEQELFTAIRDVFDEFRDLMERINAAEAARMKQRGPRSRR